MTDYLTLKKWYDYQSPPQTIFITKPYSPPKSEPINTPPSQPLRYDRAEKEDNKRFRVRPIPESPREEVMIFKMD